MPPAREKKVARPHPSWEEPEQPRLHAGVGGLVLEGLECSVSQAFWFLKQVAIPLSLSRLGSQ